MTIEVTQKKERPAGHRRPSRIRGMARYEALLEATEALLLTHSPDEIGLYQIAAQAAAPPASVYHFFPTKEAAYQALAERYLKGLLEMHAEPIEARAVATWQAFLAYDMRRGVDYYNARPAMLKIIYGGYGGVGARNIDEVTTDLMSRSSGRRTRKLFNMPRDPNGAVRSQLVLAIIDACWTASVRLHGKITEDYFQESVRAVIAYQRLFLPEYVEPTEFLRQAIERGESFSLPYEDRPAEAQASKAEGAS